MDIRFKHLQLKNFCGIHDLDVDLYDRTIVKGKNKVGKSTLKSAIYWCLFNKLADGSSPDGIRPHDKNGKDIDMVDIEVVLTMDIDGKEVRLKKTQSQNWVKDRTSQESKFKGNVNSFEINDIPKKESDFVSYMAQFIDLDNMMFCTNPYVFLRMDNKKRRATLFSLVGDVDTEIINANPKFESLQSDLQDGTLEELILRSKKVISAHKDTLKEIPARIDEVNLHIEDMTEDEIQAVKATLADAETKLADCNKVAESYESLSRTIHEDGLKIQKLISDTDIANQQARAKSGMESQKITQEIALLRGSIPQYESRIKEAKSRISDHESMVKVYKNSIEEIKAETFNDTDLRCPVCGSKYTKTKLSELKGKWQDEQDKKILDNEHQCQDCEVRIEEIKKNIAGWESEITAKQAEITEREQMLSAIEVVEFVPIKVEDNAEYQALVKEIEETKAKQEKIALSSGEEKQALLNVITDCKTKLNRLQTNDAYRQRINELTQEQLKISQAIANEEKTLDLLQEYQRAKIGVVTDRINEYFTVIKWQFFKEQINGGFAEVCIPTVDGTSYDGLLNHGDKLLAEIDLCTAFQKRAEVSCPIMIDDTESLDGDRIPTIESQLICIRRTDDDVLTIENLS